MLTIRSKVFSIGSRSGGLKQLREPVFNPSLSGDFTSSRLKTLASTFYRFFDRCYRFGAQYQATDWNRAGDAAGRYLESDNTLNQESLRDLLNIAWACRVRYPRDVVRIAKIIRQHFELALTRA